MLWDIIRKDFYEHLRTFRFSAALISIFVLVMVSTWVGGEDFLRRQTTYNRMADVYAREAREVYVPSQIIPQLHHPPTRLSIFAQGESKHLGNVVTIRRWSVPSDATGNLTDNTLLSAYSSFDLLTIFTLVISLFGVLLTYDGISGEAARGTLKLICSFPVSRGTIFVGKFIAASAVLLLPILISVLSSLLLLQFIMGITFTGADWGSLALMLLTGLLSGIVFIAIGLLCSSLVKRPSTGLVLSLLAWAVLVLLLPNAANSLSSALVELPSPSEIEQLGKETRDEIQANQPELKRGNFSIWGSFGGENTSFIDGTPMAFENASIFINYNEPKNQERAEKIWNLMKEHDAVKKKQADLAWWISAVSPTTHSRDAFTSLAGTDFETYYSFMESARRFRREMLDRFRQKGFFTDKVYAFVSRLEPGQISDEGYRTRLEEYRRMREQKIDVGFATFFDPLPADLIPPFRFDINQHVLAKAISPIGILSLMILTCFVLGFVVFLRYDVR